MQKRATAGRLPQFCADEFRTGGGDACTFIRPLKIIFAGLNEVAAFHHDEMLIGYERRVSGAVFRDDAAAVGKPKQHAVPLEILLIGVMDVEQDFGIGQQSVAFRGGQIAARQLCFSEAEGNETQMALAL